MQHEHFTYMTLGADLYGTSPEVTVEAWACHGACKVSKARFLIDRNDLIREGPMGAVRLLDMDQMAKILKEFFNITFGFAEQQLHYAD